MAPMPPRLQSYPCGPGAAALRTMQSLASRVFPVTGHRHPGDLAWNWTLTRSREVEAGAAAVWTEGDRAVAWAWFGEPQELSLQVDPAHPIRPALIGQMLDWAEDAAGSQPFTATISEDEPYLAAALRDRGYRPDADDAPFFVPMRCALSGLSGDLPGPGLAPVRLPDGYSVRAQLDDADIAGRAALHRTVWNSSVADDCHLGMRETWPYRPEFDLIALAPTGEVVAYCQGWYDESSRIGLFEPVGTHPGHRRLGLARAVGLAVLHAFAAAGGEQAAVCPRGDRGYPSAKIVYESLGFATRSRTRGYAR